MILRSSDNSPLMEITALERSGDALVIKGKAFGTMPINARLTADEARKGMKLMNLRLWLFLITLPFRKAGKGSSAAG